MSMTIYESGRIEIDGEYIDLHVTQRASGTVLYQPEITRFMARSAEEVRPYREIELPSKRYSLAHDAPASGNPGRAQFEADVRAILANS